MSLKDLVQEEHDALKEKAEGFVAGAKELAARLREKRADAASGGKALSPEDEEGWKRAMRSM